MAAGISNVSNSTKNRAKTTQIAWSLLPGKKEETTTKKKTESLIERLKRQKQEKEDLINQM